MTWDLLFSKEKGKGKAIKKKKSGNGKADWKWRDLESLLQDANLFAENEDAEHQFFDHELYHWSKKGKGKERLAKRKIRKKW